MAQGRGARSGQAVLWHRFTAPSGPICLAATGNGLARVAPDGDSRGFQEALGREWPDRPVVRDSRALSRAERQLREYLRGERRVFDLPVDLSPLTEFQRTVLRAAVAIPYGEVISYGELARRAGRSGAARAVGSALGRNPVPIVVPCHRIVRGDGSLGGYTGGLERKRSLLRLEGAIPVGDGDAMDRDQSWR